MIYLLINSFLVISQGDQGPVGEQGPQGATGKQVGQRNSQICLISLTQVTVVIHFIAHIFDVSFDRRKP